MEGIDSEPDLICRGCGEKIDRDDPFNIKRSPRITDPVPYYVLKCPKCGLLVTEYEETTEEDLKAIMGEDYEEYKRETEEFWRGPS